MVSYTGTILSNLIRMYTKKEYTHVSISLDNKLKDLYSFGRLNPYNPFTGSFVKEDIDIGTFKRFKNTKVEIYFLEVEDEKYEKLRNIIYRIKKNKEEYKFNFIGLFLVMFHKKICRKKAFYCAEFVKYVLGKSDITKKEIPSIVKPEDLQKLKESTLEYKGLLRIYDYKKTYSFRNLYKNTGIVLN